MTESIVTMDVRHTESGAAVIDIQGEVTAACQTVLSEAYDEASTSDTKLIILNFTGLNYMNSSGIGMLVTILVRANRHHQRLAAYGLTDHYRQIFELTRLDEAISIHSDEADALAAA